MASRTRVPGEATAFLARSSTEAHVRDSKSTMELVRALEPEDETEEQVQHRGDSDEPERRALCRAIHPPSAAHGSQV